MSKLIYFRDLGCQGATEILQDCLDLAQKNKEDIIKENLSNISFYFLSKTKEIENMPLASPFRTWQEIASKAQIKYTLADNLDSLSENDLIILENDFLSLIYEKDIENNYIVEEHLYDFTMKTAISCFSNFLYTSLRTKKAYNEISIAYMGDVGASNISLTNNLLNASICLKNLQSFSFSEYSARQEETGFDQSILDFAMSAGAKVFLTYSPEFIESDCDILILAPWTHQPAKDIKPMKHPYCFEQVGNIFLDSTQIVSFIEEVQSSEINLDLYQKAAITSRIATLKYMLTV